MATVTLNKGSVFEKGSYKLQWGTVNADGGGATYATDDYQMVEVLESFELSEQASAVKIGGGVTPRHDFTQLIKTATVTIFLPYGGPFSVGKIGLPIKLTRQDWTDTTTVAIALEGALLSRRETGRNGDGVREELQLDFNPHWAVEATS